MTDYSTSRFDSKITETLYCLVLGGDWDASTGDSDFGTTADMITTDDGLFLVVTDSQGFVYSTQHDPQGHFDAIDAEYVEWLDAEEDSN